MKKETRKNIEKVLNYAKDNNCSVKAACTAKKYNYGNLANAIKYARDNGQEEDLISLYDSVKQCNTIEHIDTDERAETELVRDEDGKIVSYRFKIFRRDKTPVISALTRDEMNLIYRLYSYYGASLTQRQVSRHFPDYSLVDFKRILRAFNITKASASFAPHFIEEHTPEELKEIQLREKENDFLKTIEKDEVKDLKQLVIKLTKEQMKSSISEEKLIEIIKITNKDYKELPVNTKCTKPEYPVLIIWLSDLHIGAYNAKYSSFVPLPNYNKEEIKSRLTKIVQTFAGQSYGTVYVVNLGDSLDGYNKETTRGGHQLPEIMDNKEISEAFIECVMEFFKALKANVKCDEINYLCIGESNHGGDWEWINQKLLAAYLANEGIKSYISNYGMDTFTIGNHLFVYAHGKNNETQTRQFPLTLNPQTELYFANYLAEMNLRNDHIYVVKGDLHNYAYTTGKQFDYISVGSMYGSSNYIVANFGHTKWSINYSIVTEDNMMMGTIKGNNQIKYNNQLIRKIC